MLQVLIIGCGSIAGGYDQADLDGPDILTHAKAFQKHPGFKVTACMDVDLQSAQDFANIWYIPASFSSLTDAFQGKHYDLVSVCSPTAYHGETLKSLADLHQGFVFCEKPIAADLEDARAMADIWQGRMVVNYIRRWDAQLQQLANEIRSGQYGHLQEATGTYNKGLYNFGSHMVDLLHLLIGEMDVMTAGDPIADFFEDDATVSAVLHAAGGRPITLKGTDMRDGGMTFDLEMTFDKAKIVLGEYSHHLKIEALDGKVLVDESLPLNTAMYQAVENIYQHLTIKEPLLSSEKNGLKAMEICDQIRQKSVEKNTWSKQNV